MLIRAYLDRLEGQVRDPLTRLPFADRWNLLSILSQEVRLLSGKYQWDWALSALRPIIKTSTGNRDYTLPENFGFNFARGVEDTDGHQFTVTISDGNSETPLEYVDPGAFYGMNLTAESNATPTKYTLRNSTSGRRILALSPPPDSNSDSHYTINGLYSPTDWVFENHDILMPIPGGTDLLEHRILAQVFESRDTDRYVIHQNLAREAEGSLLLTQAKSKRPRLSPRMSPYKRITR